MDFIYPSIGCVHAPPLNKIRERISKLVQLFLWGGGSCTRATLMTCPFKEAVNGWKIKKLKMKNKKFAKIKKKCVCIPLFLHSFASCYPVGWYL